MPKHSVAYLCSLHHDPEFTRALVEGKKDDKTDPHSLNQSILGGVCRSRAAAKRFIYALLLGAGIGKLTEILGCSTAEAEEALERLMVRYTGWKFLKEKVFPKDAKRGWFKDWTVARYEFRERRSLPVDILQCRAISKMERRS